MGNEALLDNSERASRVLLFFKILAVLDVLYILASSYAMTKSQSYWGFGEIQHVDFPIGFEEEFYLPNIYYLFIFTFSGLNLCSGIFFIKWFRRAYNNLHKSGVINLSYTEGWAAGAWFVPIINLFRPYIIMNEIWIVTQQIYNPTNENGEYKQIESLIYLVNVWWCFCVFSFVSDILFLFLNIEPSYWLDIVFNLISLAYIYYSYKMVTQSNIHQQMLLQYQKVKNFGKAEIDKNFE